GSAHTVPALLLPGRLEGLRLSDLADLALLQDGQIEGAACYRLQGRLNLPPLDPAEEEQVRADLARLTGRAPPRVEESPLTVWLDRATLLVRRIEQSARFEAFQTEDVTDYQPEADGAIGDDELAFGAPTGGQP